MEKEKSKHIITDWALNSRKKNVLEGYIDCVGFRINYTNIDMEKRIVETDAIIYTLGISEAERNAMLKSGNKEKWLKEHKFAI